MTEHKALRINEITTFNELLLLEKDWNILLQKSEANTIFLTHEWLVHWWRCFGTDKQLYVLIVKEGDAMVGIAPLMIVKRAILGLKKTKSLQFIGTDLSDYADFIITKDHAIVLNCIFKHLVKNKNRWDAMYLAEIAQRSSTLSLLESALKDTMQRYMVVFSGQCVSLNIKEATADELAQLLKKKDLRRHIKHLQSQGVLACKRIDTVEEANEVLEVMFYQHQKIWRERKEPSMFESEQYRLFFHGLANEMVPKKIIDLWVLSLDKKPVAIQFGFNYNASYITYCQSQDSEFQRQSVGTIMLKLYIESYVSQGMGMVDFSRGGERYKYRFSNRTSANYSLVVQKNLFAYLISKAGYRTKEMIIKNKKMHGFISRVRKMMRRTDKSTDADNRIIQKK